MLGKILGIVLRVVVLGVLLVYAIGPLAWAFSTSIKPEAEVFSNPSIIPHQPTLYNYYYVVSNTEFGVWFGNTVQIALTVTVLATIIAMFAGYALSRFSFKGRDLYGNVLLVVQMFPGVMLGIPLFVIFSRLQLANTLSSLLITYMTFALAFSIWMLKGYFDSIPHEIEDAARIDGCGDLGVLFRIMLPLASPGITTVAVFTFLLAWNDFFFAYILLVGEEHLTLQIGLYTFINQFYTDWHYLMAAAILTCVPVLFFFFTLQKYLTRGLIAGANKG